MIGMLGNAYCPSAPSSLALALARPLTHLLRFPFIGIYQDTAVFLYTRWHSKLTYSFSPSQLGSLSFDLKY